MCITWSQNDWRAASAREGTIHHVIGEYKDANGRTALMIRTDAGKWTPTVIRNVYSQDGYQENTFVYGDYDPRTDEYPEHTLDEQIALAKGDMESRGFTPVTAGVGFLVETTNPETPATTEPVHVQGRTFEEWAQVGRDNESRKPEDRIHPEHPRNHGEDRMATEDEMKAFELSLPGDERELLGMLELLSILS